jgi:putative endonuclease
MIFDTTKEIGDFGESRAVHYLRLRGYTVKERNWRYGKGELDIIAATPRSLVFVEVKARSYASEAAEQSPPPGSAVRADKKRLTRQTAQAYLHQHPTKKHPRMDVIEVFLEKNPTRKKPKVIKINHIKGAY